MLKILCKSRTSSSTITHGSSLQLPFFPSSPPILSIELHLYYIHITQVGHFNVHIITQISPKFHGTWFIVLVSKWNAQLINETHSGEDSLKACY